MRRDKDMLKRKEEYLRLVAAKTDRYLLYKVVGPKVRPLRFDLINLNGRKVRSLDLLVGTEFVIPIKGLEKGEYLFALFSAGELLQTGVIDL